MQIHYLIDFALEVVFLLIIIMSMLITVKHPEAKLFRKKVWLFGSLTFLMLMVKLISFFIVIFAMIQPGAGMLEFVYFTDQILVLLLTYSNILIRQIQLKVKQDRDAMRTESDLNDNVLIDKIEKIMKKSKSLRSQQGIKTKVNKYVQAKANEKQKRLYRESQDQYSSNREYEQDDNSSDIKVEEVSEKHTSLNEDTKQEY